mmetsp:Transcript_30398/g.78823  ORF Transcript_30398/g.78823 Transcript_30398/m.78823 type:complete len:205 (-) Transcript_30398:121-735(-)
MSSLLHQKAIAGAQCRTSCWQAAFLHGQLCALATPSSRNLSWNSLQNASPKVQGNGRLCCSARSRSRLKNSYWITRRVRIALQSALPHRPTSSLPCTKWSSRWPCRHQGLPPSVRRTQHPAKKCNWLGHGRLQGPMMRSPSEPSARVRRPRMTPAKTTLRPWRRSISMRVGACGSNVLHVCDITTYVMQSWTCIYTCLQLTTRR